MVVAVNESGTVGREGGGEAGVGMAGWLAGGVTTC